MLFRIGVDIGGTFTDFVVLDETGKVLLWKEDSTPDEPERAIQTGLHTIAEQLGLSIDGLLGSTESFVHGSTIATNTLIVRNGGPVGLVCTEGFRDVLYFRDGYKPERFNLQMPRPDDFVDRHLRIGVNERIDPRGNVRIPLVAEDVRAAAARFREAGVRAVAVAFLWSVMNGDHEERAAAILREELPDVPVLCSKDVLNEIREWERTSATVLSAYVMPSIGDYLRRLETFLVDNGLHHSAQYMQINGGCATVDEIMQRPVNTLGSGPAAAPAAALYHVGASPHGPDGDDACAGDVITVDMGGTSFDTCVIRAGRPVMSRAVQVEFQPIGVSAVEVHSIGAGGGSIAWIDGGGALRVGPQSAGSRPGPACYDHGGTEPTVTDANVALGYLDPDGFLGGRRRLRDDLSIGAIRTRVAEPLGIDVLTAAAGIIELVNTNMVGGIKAMSVERGIDPRDYLLVSGGGAGGLHAARLARLIGMRRLVIPPEASTFCAFGMAVTDVRHDYTISYFGRSTTIEVSELEAPFQEMEHAARERLRRDGFTDDRIRLERFVDARYRNQLHELTIPVPTVDQHDASWLDDILGTFHRQHETQFTYSVPEAEVEFLHWRVAAYGLRPMVARPQGDAPEAPSDAVASALMGERDAYFPEFRETRPTPVYRWEDLIPGARVGGPAIIRSATTTVVINPTDQLTMAADRRLLVDVLP